jgi:hypothetical protein
MNRRSALAATTLLSLAPALAAGAEPSPRAPTPAPAAPSQRTRWIFRHSEGLDALAFLGPLSGKEFYARYYADDLAAFKPRLAAPAQDALARLVSDADAAGFLLWPQLALLFSGGPDRSLAELLQSLDQAEQVLKPPFETGIYWDQADWERFIAARPQIRTVLLGLRDAGFAAFWQGRMDAAARQKLDGLHARLGVLDVIGQQQRLVARPLQPTITVEVLRFCRPHGVKLQGQRMLVDMGAPDAVVVLTAAHEMLHPPFDMRGATARACLAVLGADPLFKRILAEKSPDTGYNTLEGILDEDTVQALDQIIQERLGMAVRPAAQRWAQSDEGMHVLAAGLYGLLKADGFDQRGGSIEAWMEAAARTGRLAPPSLHAAAAAVLGRPVDRLWQPPGQARG